MATVKANYNREGNIVSYKITCCVGRYELGENAGKQAWKTKTIKRPVGLTPKKERDYVKKFADDWAVEQKRAFDGEQGAADKDKIMFCDFVRGEWMSTFVDDGKHTASTISFFEHTSKPALVFFAKKRLRDISSNDVIRYINNLRKNGTRHDGKPFSDGTIQHYYNTLRNILECARLSKYIDINPCQDIRESQKPTKTVGSPDVLSKQEQELFWKYLRQETGVFSLDAAHELVVNANTPEENWTAFNGLFWFSMMDILLCYGLRRGEVLGLQWADIGFDGEDYSIFVSRNVTVDRKSETGFTIGATKTKKSRRIFIDTPLYKILQELRSAQEKMIGETVWDKAFIFSKAHDPYSPIAPNTPTRWLARFNKKYRLHNVSPHDLRHTFTTNQIEHGTPLKAVQDALGDSTQRTVLTHYASSTQESMKKISEVAMEISG